MTLLAFVDTETTSLSPEAGEVWEVGLILRGAGDSDGEWEWQLPVDLGRADAMALTVGRFYERRWPGDRRTTLTGFADRFARLTHGAHLVGVNPAFDAAFLAKLLRANGACPGWHYHLVDVLALAAGWLAAGSDPSEPRSPETHIPSLDKCCPPWRSDDLSRAVGVEPEDFDRHSALGDARWAKAIYDAIMGAAAEKEA